MLNPAIASLVVMFVSSALAIVLAIPCAIAWTKFPSRGQAVGASLLFGFLLVPLYVHAGAWNAGFGPIGWLRLAGWLPYDFAFQGKAAVIWIHGLGLVPWTTCILTIGMMRIPNSLEQTAMLEGGVRRVVWRAWLPTLVRWSSLAWLWGATSVASDMLVTNLYRVQTLTELCYLQLTIGIPGFSGTEESYWMAWSCLPAVSAGLFATWLTWQSYRAFAFDERSTARPMFSQYARGCSILFSSLAWFTVFLVVALPIISLVGKAGWVAVQSEGEIQRSWSLPQVVYSMFGLGDFSEEFSWSAQLALLASSIATLSAWILAGLLSKTRLIASIAMGIAIAMAGLPGPIVNLGVKRTLESLPERISDMMLEESLAAPALALQFRCMPLAFLVFYSLWRRWRIKHDPILQLENPSWWSLQRIVAHGLMRPILAIWITTAAIATADLSTYILVLPPQVSTLAMRIFELLHYGVRYKEAGLCLSLLVIGCTAGIATSRLIQAKWMDRE